MRGLVKLIEQKYGKNTTAIFKKWEKMEGKVSNFKNHQRFSLRCLDKGLVPVSLKLKNLIRTQRGKGIIQKAEKQLLNERIKNINYTLEWYEHDKYMYKNELEELLKQDQEIWNACLEEIEKRKELRHRRVMERQIRKFKNKIKNRVAAQTIKVATQKNRVWIVMTELGNGLLISPAFLLLRTKRVSWHMVQILWLHYRNPPGGIYNKHWKGMPKLGYQYCGRA